MSNVHRLRITDRIFFVTVRRLEYMHLNPVRKGLVSQAEEWQWSSYNNFAPEKAAVADCPIQVDYVNLPAGYRA